MCGLLTFISADGQAAKHRDQIAEALEAIHHRGPDETGVTVDDGNAGVFGFKRLSIIDVEHSHQPLPYLDGRYLITFNGEIYNYLELRKQLVAEFGATFTTEGDTETIVAAYHHWGPSAVSKLRGMFAFVIWDRETQQAFGARDPFGIKPLHYTVTQDGAYFASEKKALLPFVPSAQAGDAGLNRRQVSHYFTLQYVPEPDTLHQGVSRIECGESFTYTPGGNVVRQRYFRPDFHTSPVDDEQALFKRIRNALEESVEFHLRSEVPVGAFLSSGIDSTAVVAMARKHKPDILTFTAGYDVEGYSEVSVAQTSAKWLNVTTIPALINAEDMMNTLPRIIWHLDDPVADPALVPLYFVAKKAAEHVTVVLSGEGADELFGGYGIYREPLSLNSITGLPTPMQKGLRVLSKVIPEGVKGKSFIERGTTPIQERYFGHVRMFTDEEKSRLLKNYDPSVRHTDLTAQHYADAAGWDPVTQMQYIDMFTWLRGDILVKADRMSMANSLELRVPFLDTGVFEVARTIPQELKVTKKGMRKYAMRQALEGVVPPQIVNRPKLGFPVPTRVWLRDLMYEWARDILRNSAADDIVDLNYVLGLLEAHRRGDRDYSTKIWTVLVFCVWHAIFVAGTLDPRPAPAVSRWVS
ncbi:MAG: asparagine synthase (glutamine-hydrolyzing) [Corynebacteriales bacterium]|nr:asparagine synthase (glutamine-hydrolyzing) [Mycobacteriales bacterium]